MTTFSNQTGENMTNQSIQTKHPGGRPTKYNPTVIRKTKEYLYSFDDDSTEPLNKGDKLPTIAGLCKYLKLNRDTIYSWIKQEDKREFSDVVSRIMTEQERILINQGLDGGFNSKVTTLMLGKHGYHDKPEAQGNQGITVNVNRGSVEIQAGGDTLTISDIDSDQVSTSIDSTCKPAGDDNTQD